MRCPEARPEGESPRLPARIVRYVWALPCTAVGLAGACMLLAFAGARWRRVGGVLEVAPERPGSALTAPLGFVAITFGHVVLGCSAAELQRLRAHEHAHVAQYERWGVVFLAAYPLASLYCWLRGRRAHHDNTFEVQARRAETLGAAPRHGLSP